MKTSAVTAELHDEEGFARSDAAAAQSRTYEHFDGGWGREVNFRPPRYQPADLGPVGATVTVTVGSTTTDCELVDVSQNGVAFDWRNGNSLNVGDTIASLSVSFDGHEAYRGEAQVRSVRPLKGRQVVGASFLDTLMNIEDVLHLRDVKAWKSARATLALAHRSWRIEGHEGFKSLVADLRLFLLDAQRELGDLEASIPWNVAHGEHDSPARDALIERVRAEVVPEILRFSNGIDAAVRLASPSEHEALKEFSGRHLQDLFMQAPWMRRAREKPLGYPGDYEVMNGLYGDHFAGATLFAKAVNLAFVNTPAAVAVRERKNLIKEKLAALLDRAEGTDRTVRILSIAAGPAQEIYELLAERAAINVPVEILLFDQDTRALAFSYGRLKRLVASRWAEKVRLIYRHDSIKRLLRDSNIFSEYGSFDAIFSCGLFDYLRHPTAVSLSRSLYANLAPGGTVYIGNMVPASQSRWFLELHLDWFLLYKERSEIMEFARAAAPDAELAILDEPSGVNPFVSMTRS